MVRLVHGAAVVALPLVGGLRRSQRRAATPVENACDADSTSCSCFAVRDSNFCKTCPECGTCGEYCGGLLVEALVRDLEASNSSGVFMTLGGTPSTIYTWQDMTTAAHGMATTGAGNMKLYAGEGQNHVYGLVNIAAFLAQCMKETIVYDACDENNWSNGAVVDEVGGTAYSATSACGQLKQSYQDYTCSAEEDELAGGKMACDPDPNMEMRARTQATWYGAPTKMFCAPRSKVPKAPRWDSNPWCNPNRPDEQMPFPDDVDLDTYFAYVNAGSASTCRDYAGQKAGGWSFDGCSEAGCAGSEAPLFGQPEGRTDLESCCWWGRGVIQTTGTCNFGKLNYYLGKRAADEGRSSLFPKVDFCANPNAICEPESPPELKWIAGFFYWLNAVQTYDHSEYNFMTQLKSWVDGGLNMEDNIFIDGTSGIVNRGCHNPPNCGTGELDGREDRQHNFAKVLTAMGLA